MARCYTSILVCMVALLATQLACAQDCMGTTIYVTGTVQDEKGNPIASAEIIIDNEAEAFSEDFEETLRTNENGEFESGAHFVYLCDPVNVRVNQYEYQSVIVPINLWDYYPPDASAVPDKAPIALTIMLTTLP
jgi:hypothetical protein